MARPAAGRLPFQLPLPLEGPLQGMDPRSVPVTGMGGLRRLQDPAAFSKARFAAPLYAGPS